MPRQLNTSEEFVNWVCRQSFLSLWSYASPCGKKGKELCDILIVCDPDVIIVSVKDIKLSDPAKSESHARWENRAVEGSAKQIYGAERWIGSAKHVIRADGSEGLPIPDIATRRIHRLAVAFGANGQVGFKIGDFGKGYIHVLDERSFQILLTELDTVTDFVAYLEAKRALTAKARVLFEGEENLLALYLHRNRTFPEEPDFLIVESDLWETLVKKPEFSRRNESNRDSYDWDRLIESLGNDILSNNLQIGPGLADCERGVRVMARENRFSRRVLGRAFSEFVQDVRKGKTKARLIQSLSGVRYVFLRMPPNEDREKHLPELRLRCYVARGMLHDSSTVIGLGVSDGANGFALTLLYYDHPEWTAEDVERARQIQEELDYFRVSRARQIHEEEYPKAFSAKSPKLACSKTLQTKGQDKKVKAKRKQSKASRRRNRGLS